MNVINVLLLLMLLMLLFVAVGFSKDDSVYVYGGGWVQECPGVAFSPISSVLSRRWQLLLKLIVRVSRLN